MPIAFNDKGDILTIGKDGQWSPAMTADNPQTGERLVLDGIEWKPAPLPPQSMWKAAYRAADQLAGGFSDSVLNAVSAVPEFAATALRTVSPRLAPEPGFYTEGVKNAARAVGNFMMPNLPTDMGPAEPQGRLEKILRKTGEGVGDVASMVVPAAAVSRLAQAGGTTANVARAIAAQPAMQLTSGAVGGAVTGATDNPWAGMAASVVGTPLALSAGRRIVTPVNTQLAGEEARLAAIAERQGIRLTPGQATGSRPLQAMESALTTMPFASGAQREVYADQARALNRAILRQAGINADDASPHVIDQAFRDIGQEFNDLMARSQVRADPQLSRSVNQTANDYMRRLPTDVRAPFQSYVEDINALFNGASGPQRYIDGETYQRIVSDIRTAARNTGDSDLRNALRGLVNNLDDAMERASGTATRDEWRDVRSRYRNILAINDAMTAGTQVSRTTGNIPAGSFTQAVKGMDKAGYGRGRGAMNDLARIGDFIAQKIPNSGTPERQQAMQILQGGVPISAGGAGYALSGGDPLLAIMSGAATYGLPPMAQRLINSRAGQAYLRNRAMPAAQNPGMPGLFLSSKILAPQVYDGVPGDKINEKRK